jgi:predicted CoA-substrate-specific enzyme activase
MAKEISTLGICIGAATVSMALLKASPEKTNRREGGADSPQITDTWRIAHGGNPSQAFLSMLDRIAPESIDRIACTGRKFREYVNLSTIPEPEAVEQAYQFLKPADLDCPAIISAGGETFMVYVLNRCGQIDNVLTGNRCASGTGEFFVQQLRRLDISLEQTALWSDTTAPYQVSGRCSVFCKSDCTHASNKGIPKSRIAAGLSRMMADRILALLNRVPRKSIMITGGTVHNQMMKRYLGQEIEGLIVPEAADCFEAVGAALWALSHDTKPLPEKEKLFVANRTSFPPLDPLANFNEEVVFKEMTKGDIASGDVCILGLDVGSTTTKAVLMRERDDAILASVYLRTNGDPVGASRQCYTALLSQVSECLDPSLISIVGLGVCGSGRQIAGLHALTEGIINEIIAHAAAAAYFDPQVDTLFEIGGQDAKYTLITNGVPSDYAMNEACSAGTGSFLEESALETLGVGMEEIEKIALTGNRPCNFSDQCAAFISSDIKNAIHEGVGQADIVAGLVYSICMNYANRVKGSRPVGKKIFMQGGVCYNKAVPLAMAALVGKPIVVPPEPGLMGAFGVALEVKKRIRAGQIDPGTFDLKTLSERSVSYGKSFICKGGAEKCDRRCEIATVILAGRKYPFGGACNRYYNLRHKIGDAGAGVDLVRIRQDLVFKEAEAEKAVTGDTPGDRVMPADTPNRGRIAFNRSYMMNTYYPFFATFFKELGLSITLPDTPSKKGISRQGAAFCYPGELAHGFFYTLLTSDPRPDFVFLPHFKSIPSGGGNRNSVLCPLVQSEPFYLKTTFRKEIGILKQQGTRVVSPLLELSPGLEAAKPAMMKVAASVGAQSRGAEKAFGKAVAAQNRFDSDLKAYGRQALSDLESAPGAFAVVVFGRSYNAFAPEAHMGIPGKFASRGIKVIPFDALCFEDEPAKRNMYWGTGRQILQAARMVRRHQRLFGVYTTSFSCGPDSFLIGYFRQIMGRKPSLTLELDSHTADAGLETRVEAFLDIVSAYLQESGEKKLPENRSDVSKNRPTMKNSNPGMISTSGEPFSFQDPRVTLLIPSMGKLSTEAVSASFRSSGINAVAHQPADEAVLKLGRSHTTGKECLPLILTTGTLLSYIRQRKRDEFVAYFMATTSGPCRFGQYAVFMEDLIRRYEIPDVAMFSLNSDTGYSGLKNGTEQRIWWGLVIADVMEDIRVMLMADAEDIEFAMTVFDEVWQGLLGLLENGSWETVQKGLEAAAGKLRRIGLKRPIAEVPVVALMGEIFVRRDGLSRQWLPEKLAEKGFASICAPISEWVHYCDYLVQRKLSGEAPTFLEKSKLLIRSHFKKRFEKRIRDLLAGSGLVRNHMAHIPGVVDTATPYISPQLTGEAILTVGSSLTEVADHCCGVVCIGPFGCMPSRIAESILSETMTARDKMSVVRGNGHLSSLLSDIDDLPFLAIESDGSPFPHLIHAKLEAFCLRAERLHERMLEKNVIGHSSSVIRQ